MPAPFFSYCLNDPFKNYDALERLVLAVDPDTLGEDSSLGDVAGYAAMILSVLRDLETGGLADSYATQVLGFVSTELLERVVASPTTATAVELNDLGIELLHAAAAFGGVEDVVPYGTDELDALSNGVITGSHSAILAMTIGFTIMNGDKIYGPALLRLLTTNQDENLRTPYEWTDAFLVGLLMHAAWSYFPDASDHEQQLIIQRYFYYAVVAGVPVRSWLALAFDTNPQLLPNTLMQKLTISQEVVPQDTALSRGVDFANVMREYVTAVNQNSIPTLAAEKFLGKWYTNDATGNRYREWLRITLSTVYGLQTGNL